MDTSIVLKNLKDIKIEIENANAGVVDMEIEIPFLVDFKKFPFESKFIVIECICCKKKVRIGIYENGGYIKGEGASKPIRTGWDYPPIKQLDYDEANFLSKMLKISYLQRKEKYSLIINDEYQHCFILYKACVCKEEYFLIFEPAGELYREISLQFYIYSLYNVKLSESFKKIFFAF